MKKFLVSTIIAVFIFLLIFAWVLVYNKRDTNVAKRESRNTQIAETIEDDCTEEYEYDQKLSSLTVSSTLGDKTKTEKEINRNSEEKFVLRNKDGVIVIYKTNEKNEEEEYEKTHISIDYLAEEDKNNIKNGLQIIGQEELNKIIEDFE